MSLNSSSWTSQEPAIFNTGAAAASAPSAGSITPDQPSCGSFGVLVLQFTFSGVEDDGMRVQPPEVFNSRIPVVAVCKGQHLCQRWLGVHRVLDRLDKSAGSLGDHDAR